MGPDKALRNKVFRALHAEALKRKIDHDDLRDIFKVKSLSTVETPRLIDQLKAWTGKGVRRRTALPRKGYGQGDSPEVQMAGLEDLTTLRDAFAIAGMGGDAQRAFIARQLRGREEVRTRADFHKVFSGVRAMNRRKEQTQC